MIDGAEPVERETDQAAPAESDTTTGVPAGVSDRELLETIWAQNQQILAYVDGIWQTMKALETAAQNLTAGGGGIIGKMLGLG